MVPAGPLEAYIAAREALVTRAPGGTADARTLSELTDDTVAALAATVSSRPATRFALLALGGYGARRLLPHSDIDLLIVSRGTARELEPLVRAVAYPLWDAGLAVGYQVRTPKEYGRALVQDLGTFTGALTARVIAGDEALAEEALSAAFVRVGRDARRHLARLGARERPGSPYLLEPDLKNGAGGQRDIDELVWRAAIVGGAPARDVWPLVSAGLLTLDEAAALAHAQDALTAARWRLHAAASRARNTMTLEDAEDAGVDTRATQQAIETVHHALLDVRERVTGRVVPTPGPLDGEGLLRLVRGGAPDLAALERAVARGCLDASVPGFRELMTLRRPGLSHRYTVGAHCVRALAALADTRAGGPLARVDPSMHAAVVVAALTHDIGKREPGPGHAGRGAPDAAAAASALGFDDAVATDAGTLVREHLLLAEVATRADLTDEDVILAAAARLGDPRLVGAAHALTEADLRATGPDVWTPWRAALVAELAGRMEAALRTTGDGAGIVSAAEATRAKALRDAASVGAPGTLLRFVERAPLRYLARRSAADVLRDARLALGLRAPSAGGGFSLGVRPGPVERSWNVDVIARDRPDLLATLAGVFALGGLDVLAAEAVTDRTGIAIDTFTVSPATLAPVEHETWMRVERALASALIGRLDLHTRLAERRRHYPAARDAVPARVRVGETGAVATAVRVRAADRIGLLHDLAHAFAAAGLTIHRAVVTTSSGVADDTFEVTDESGAPPDPAVLRDSLIGTLTAAAAGSLPAAPR